MCCLQRFILLYSVTYQHKGMNYFGQNLFLLHIPHSNERKLELEMVFHSNYLCVKCIENIVQRKAIVHDF